MKKYRVVKRATSVWPFTQYVIQTPKGNSSWRDYRKSQYEWHYYRTFEEADKVASKLAEIAKPKEDIVLREY